MKCLWRVSPRTTVPDCHGLRNFLLIFIVDKFTVVLGNEIVKTRLVTILQRSKAPTVG